MRKEDYPTLPDEAGLIERQSFLSVYTDTAEEARSFFGRPDAPVRLYTWAEKGSLFLVWAAPFPPPDPENWEFPA